MPFLIQTRTDEGKWIYDPLRVFTDCEAAWKSKLPGDKEVVVLLTPELADSLVKGWRETIVELRKE